MSAIRILTEKPGERPSIKEQWQVLKERYPDVLFVFHIGEEGVMFHGDADRARVALGEPGDTDSEFRFPWRRVEKYAARLLAHAHRVAICDGVAPLRQGK